MLLRILCAFKRSMSRCQSPRRASPGAGGHADGPCRCGCEPVLAVSLADGLESRHETTLAQGETAEAGGYRFRFDSLGPAAGPNYDAQRAQFTVSRAGLDSWSMFPEKRVYRAQVL